MDFLIRFSQVHESFRKPEIEALAQLFDLEYQWIHYKEYVRFSISFPPRKTMATNIDSSFCTPHPVQCTRA